MEAPNYMLAMGEQLVSNGYPIIPVIPNMKVPGRFTGGDWRPAHDWQRHCERPTKPFEVDIWSRWPECAIGLACGRIIGIDIDIFDNPEKPTYPIGKPGDDATLAIQLEKLARRMLGDTPAMRIGQAPKRALYYRAASPFKGRKLHPLEVYGVGSQMVIYGVHPGTGRPYEWPDDGLLELDASSLPEITEAQAMEWLEAAYRLTPDQWKPKTLAKLSSGDVSAWRGPSDPLGTYEAVKSALTFIPNDDLDGSSWILICNAIKAALGAQGRELWLDWSKSSAKSGASGKTDTAERRYDSARPTNVGAGSLYYMAEQRGWVPASDLVLNGHKAELMGAPHPAAGLIAKAAKLERARKVGTSQGHGIDPIIFDGLDGLLKELHTFIVSTSRSPQPFLAIGAALAAVGAAAGRRYRSATNIRTNVMIIGVADSGAGKDRPLKTVVNAFIDAGLEEYLGGSKIASGTGLLTAVRDHPVVLFALDEIGHMMGNANSKQAGSHKTEILPLLTEIWSKASDIYLGINYGDSKTNPRSTIHQPHICLYGATVPHIFWKAFGNAAVADGSLARFLLFQSPENYPDTVDDLPDTDTPPDIIARLREIAGCPPSGGNLSDIGFHHKMTSAEAYKSVITVGCTDEANVALRERTREETSLKRQHEGTPQTAFLARIYEHTVRLALIKSVSRDPASPVITLDDVKWSNALVDHSVRAIMRETDENVADNQVEADSLMVMKIIRKHGTITHDILGRKTQKLKRRDLAEITQALQESGQILISEEANGCIGRPRKTYTSLSA